jgi:hypothetical protein
VISSNRPQSERVLWCLRRRRTDVTCVLHGESIPVEVKVLHDGDIVVTELFEEERFALGWARSYELRLRDLGWTDSPVSKAS